MALRLTTSIKTLRLALLTSVALMIMAIPAVVMTQAVPSAHAVTPPDDCFNFEAESGTITAYNSYEGNYSPDAPCQRGDITIPATIAGVAVTALGQSSFSGSQLTSVTIPDSVTSIGDSTFHGNRLTSIDFSDTLVSIGAEAFVGNQLTSIDLPDTLISIGDNAFKGDAENAEDGNQLTSLLLPNSVTNLGMGAFSYNQLNNVTLSSSLTSIPDMAFSYNHLTSVIIPGSVTNIDYWAFAYNQLISVTVNGTTVMEEGVFEFNGPTFNNLDYFYLQDGTPEGDTLAIQYLRDHVTFVPLYTVDPSNPAGYISTAYPLWLYSLDEPSVSDFTGGYIVNPASYTATFKDTNGTTLAPSVMRTGPALTDYRLGSNPAADFSRYYSIGDTVTIQPPTVAGFTTPATRQHTLSTTADVVSIVYTPISAAPLPSTPLASPQPPVAIPAQPVTPVAPETPTADPVTSTDAVYTIQTPTAPSRPDAPSRADENTTHVEQDTTPIPWVPIAVGSTVTIGAGWGAWLLVRMRMFKP